MPLNLSVSDDYFFWYLDWGYCFFRKKTTEGACVLKLEENILYADENDSLERGTFNDVRVTEKHCQSNAFA